MVSNRLCIGVSKMQSSLSRLFRSREMDSLGDSAFSVARAWRASRARGCSFPRSRLLFPRGSLLPPSVRGTFLVPASRRAASPVTHLRRLLLPPSGRAASIFPSAAAPRRSPRNRVQRPRHPFFPRAALPALLPWSCRAAAS